MTEEKMRQTEQIIIKKLTVPGERRDVPGEVIFQHLKLDASNSTSLEVIVWESGQSIRQMSVDRSDVPKIINFLQSLLKNELS